MADRAADVAQQVRDLFDAKAAAWPSKYAPGGRLADRLTQLADAVVHHVPAGGTVLDLGCGTGELARTAAAAGMRVVACDISRAMLRHAAAGDAKGLVEWIRLEPAWRTLPFVSTAFDAIIAASVLEYVDKPRELMHECARVLRPGGVMLCTVPNLTHPVRLLEWPATMVVRGPRVRTLCSRSRRLDAYLTYLTISRHRHSVQWWRTTAAHAGLLIDSSLIDATKHSSLRLLALRRPESC